MLKKLTVLLVISISFICASGAANAQGTNFFYARYDDAGTNYWYVPSVPRTPGASTQYLVVWFYSHNFFSRSPNSHFSIGLKAFIDPPAVSGRGITIGHTHLIDPDENKGADFGGCQDGVGSLPDGIRPGLSQIENFGEAYVYRNTCGPSTGYSDNAWYKVYIHANDTNWVAYWVEDAYGNEIDQGVYPAVNDGAHPINYYDTGIWIAAAPNPVGETGYWAMQFWIEEYGWF